MKNNKRRKSKKRTKNTTTKTNIVNPKKVRFRRNNNKYSSKSRKNKLRTGKVIIGQGAEILRNIVKNIKSTTGSLMLVQASREKVVSLNKERKKIIVGLNHRGRKVGREVLNNNKIREEI